jgi:UbiD family decarboxylase
MVAIQIEAELLRTITLPGVRQVHITDGGCGAFNCVVSVTKRFDGYGRMLGAAVLGTWAGRPVKNLIIVDDDIDAFDWNQIEWALATRFQPARDLQILQSMIGHALDPSIPDEEKKRHSGLTSKMIIDATRHSAANYERECGPDEATARHVEQNWENYGILGAAR